MPAADDPAREAQSLDGALIDLLKAERNILLARLAAAERERDGAVRLVRNLEWSVAGKFNWCCPACGGGKCGNAEELDSNKGHAPDCALAALLARAGGAET